MASKKHPNKEIEAALCYAEAHSWTVKKAKSGQAHAWGTMTCPTNDKCRTGDFCRISILSTPSNTHKHAKQLYKAVNGCTSSSEEDDDEEP